MATSRPCRPGVLAASLCLLSSSLASADWSARVDPPKEAMPKPASTDFAVPFPGNFGGGGEALYPSTPSTFVAIGKNAFDKDVRQVWNLATRAQVGEFRGRLGLDDRILALSPDGAYLAGKATSRKAVEVRAARNGRSVRTFDVESPFVDFVDFAGPDRLVFGRLADRKLEVADIKSGDKVMDLVLDQGCDREGVALSPGRAYLAVASRDGGDLRIYDLATGMAAGQAQTPRIKTHVARCLGLAYSDDGAELAGLFELFNETHLACWDAATGKELADFDLGKEVAKPPFYNGRGLDWLPDKSAWLVHGTAIVDRPSGKKMWSLPYDNQDLKASPRRFLDAGHALVVSSAPTMSLRSYEIPRDKVAGAAKIVRAGGNAADAVLPPLKSADASTARRVALQGRAQAWSVTPGSPSSPLRLTSRPMTLKGKVDDFRSLLFPGPGSSQVVVVGTPKLPGQPDAYEGQARWIERFDLAGGRALGRVDLPNVSDPIAVAPDGASILLREGKARDRLDLFAADGKPIVGWRPYEKETGDARAVAWAGCLDPGKVLTLSRAGMLVLWSVPDCRPRDTRQ